MPQKRPAPRLALIDEAHMNDAQRALLASLRASHLAANPSPRAGRSRPGCTRRTSASLRRRLARIAATTRPCRRGCRNSPFCAPRGSGARNTNGSRTRRSPRRPASSRKTIADLQAGREPKSAPKDERAIYAFVQELYKTRRVSDRTYKRVQSLLGDAATVELVGILGYYTLIAMTLNVFRMMPPADAKLGFAEPPTG